MIHNLAESQEQIVRYAALLRGTESAWQAVSYGTESIGIMAQVGGVYLNFALWGLAIIPAWMVLRHFGTATTAQSDVDTETASITPDGIKEHGSGGEEADADAVK